MKTISVEYFRMGLLQPVHTESSAQYRRSHGRADLTRAVMEGVTLQIRDLMAKWQQYAIDVKTIRIGGGATRSSLWNQIQADVYGVPVQTLKVEESSALGAAILGGVGGGVFGSIQEGVKAMVQTADTITPIAANHRIYEDLFEVFVHAKSALGEDVFGKLAEVQALGPN